MADSGPLWGLVGALGGGIVSQLVNALLTARRDHSTELRDSIERLALVVGAIRDQVADTRERVAGIEGIVQGFVVGPASRGEPPPGPRRR